MEVPTASGPCWRTAPPTGCCSGLARRAGSRGRLTPEAERALLDYYWKHCKVKNDIATARQSTWWVTGSENHDINFKSGNLLSSQIFMHEPDYKDRIYPDLGRMQGYFYGDGGTFRVGPVSAKTKLGSGNYKDGKKYNAADHYQAWVSFWKEYLAERRGTASSSNTMPRATCCTRSAFCMTSTPGARTRNCAGRRECLSIWPGRSGGRIRRWGSPAGFARGEPGYSKMSGMSEFFLGGPSGAAAAYVFSDYQWPRQVWEIALGRPAMGEYAFVSRKPGEAQDVWPQPPGTEYTMLVRPDSRTVRYSWVTPDYVLGTRMDHPDALYHHLGGAAEGITFSTTPGAVIRWSFGMSMAVQHRGVAVVQAKRRSVCRTRIGFRGMSSRRRHRRSPSALTLTGLKSRTAGSLSRRATPMPPSGWCFLPWTRSRKRQEGNVLAHPPCFRRGRLRIVQARTRSLYMVGGRSEDKGRPPLEAKDPYAALVVEASRKPHHATLEAFKKDVLKNPIR